MVLDISKLLRKNTKDSNASQVYTGKRIVETVFITDNARIVILAGIEAVIVECETTVKVVVKYSFSIGAFLVNLFNFVLLQACTNVIHCLLYTSPSPRD